MKVNDRNLRVVKLLAEGGFSYVYLGWAGDRKFAIKKILCQTPEQVSGQTE